jgi:hypothetical protein
VTKFERDYPSLIKPASNRIMCESGLVKLLALQWWLGDVDSSRFGLRRELGNIDLSQNFMLWIEGT